MKTSCGKQALDIGLQSAEIVRATKENDYMSAKIIRAAAVQLLAKQGDHERPKDRQTFSCRISSTVRADLDQMSKDLNMTKGEILERGIRQQHDLYLLTK